MLADAIQRYCAPPTTRLAVVPARGAVAGRCHSVNCDWALAHLPSRFHPVCSGCARTPVLRLVQGIHPLGRRAYPYDREFGGRRRNRLLLPAARGEPAWGRWIVIGFAHMSGFGHRQTVCKAPHPTADDQRRANVGGRWDGGGSWALPFRSWSCHCLSDHGTAGL